VSCEGGWWEVKNARCKKDGVLIVEWSAVVVYVQGGPRTHTF